MTLRERFEVSSLLFLTHRQLPKLEKSAARAGKGSQGRFTDKGAGARIFLKELWDKGNYSPVTGDVLLPPFGKTYYYERYAAQHPLGVEKETFLHLWRTLFPKMKVPSDQRLGMCRYCTEAKEKLELAVTEADRDAIAKELQEHLLFIQGERAHYHNVRKEAKENPRYFVFDFTLVRKKLALIIDWMDSKKTTSPHLARRYRGDPDPLKLRVCGVLAHGPEQAEWAYISYEFSSEANTNITCLLKTLEHIASGDLRNLPRHLHVQMDNSGKENKNNNMHGFLAALVQLSHFDLLEISYLPTGHTHEDVDALFSRFYRKVDYVCYRFIRLSSLSL